MQTYAIVPEQGQHAGIKQLFFTSTRYNISVGENDVFVISANIDGTGEICVDDQITIRITDESDDRVFALYTHDYGLNGVQHTQPVVLNEINPEFDKLRGKKVRVTTECADLYGGITWSTSYFLIVKGK